MADFQKASSFIQAAEGGLSRDTNDSASANPAPWPYRGVAGWHTSRGVTFSTFQAMAPRLGYAVTPENFFTMPDEIWYGIFKNGYWDEIKGDTITSVPVAITLADFAYNSGPGTALRNVSEWLEGKFNVAAKGAQQVASAINTLTAKGDKDFFLSLIELRKSFYEKLNNPAEERGWMQRMDDLQAKGLQLIMQHKTIISAGAFFLFSLLSHS